MFSSTLARITFSDSVNFLLFHALTATNILLTAVVELWSGALGVRENQQPRIIGKVMGLVGHYTSFISVNSVIENSDCVLLNRHARWPFCTSRVNGLNPKTTVKLHCNRTTTSKKGKDASLPVALTRLSFLALLRCWGVAQRSTSVKPKLAMIELWSLTLSYPLQCCRAKFLR